jgi:maltose alpha-D-glucosyltransferase/alpha-amylase
MHRAFGADTADPAFRPEPMQAADLREWTEAAEAMARRALDGLAAAGTQLDPQGRDLAEALWARRAELTERLRAALGGAPTFAKTRHHGDYHLGQVLVANGDAVIVDFEGEPARPLEERRAKGSPLRDVAGLLRSFDYASSVAAAGDHSATATAAPTDRRIALLQRWQAEAEDAFLRAYRAAAAEAPDKWVPEEGEAALLDLFLIEKAAYEVRYEAANRPTWIGLPLRGLAALAERVTA